MGTYIVKLEARGIQVTAEGEAQARRYAESDASEFMGEWIFKPVEAKRVDGADPSENMDDLSRSVDLEEASDGLWTFTLTVDVVVRAGSAAEACLEALETPGRLMRRRDEARWGVAAP